MGEKVARQTHPKATEPPLANTVKQEMTDLGEILACHARQLKLWGKPGAPEKKNKGWVT